jgi:hypothetical protein
MGRGVTELRNSENGISEHRYTSRGDAPLQFGGKPPLDPACTEHSQTTTQSLNTLHTPRTRPGRVICEVQDILRALLCLAEINRFR